MIREELRLMSEGLTPDEHEDVLRDPQAFAGSLLSSDPKLKEAFFFPAQLIGKGSKAPGLFYKNLLMLRGDANLIKEIKKSLVQAFADVGMGGISDSSVHLVRTSDEQWFLRIGYQNLWQKVPKSDPPEYKLSTRGALPKKLAALDWGQKDPDSGKQKYVVLQAGHPAITRGLTRTAKRTRKVAVPKQGGGKKGGSGIYRSTIGQLGGLKGLFGLGGS